MMKKSDDESDISRYMDIDAAGCRDVKITETESDSNGDDWHLSKSTPKSGDMKHRPGAPEIQIKE